MSQKKFQFIPCIICSQKALWAYMPGDENFCDNCVPRGCSCNQNEDGTENRDAKGRLWPCCEYSMINDSDHLDLDYLQAGIASYYKYNPEMELEDPHEHL